MHYRSGRHEAIPGSIQAYDDDSEETSMIVPYGSKEFEDDSVQIRLDSSIEGQYALLTL